MNVVLKIRPTIESDIPNLVQIEVDRYDLMYKNNPAKKAEVAEVFRRRLVVAKDWMLTLVMDGEAAGFITGQPTHKKPEDFKSWEDSTDGGTLESTFQPTGENVYVVNLDVSRLATPHNGHYMLMAYLGGKIIKTGKDTIMFESRMPNFRQWVIDEYSGGLDAWSKLSKRRRLEVAQRYSKLTISKDGRQAPYDKLLRFYEGSGFKLVKVLPNAFSDEESLDFGMLCTAHNPVPKSMRWTPINWLVGSLLQKIGKSEKLLSRFVG